MGGLGPMAGLGPMDGLGGLPFRGPAPGMARGSQDSLGSEKLDSHVQSLNLSSLNWLNCHYVPLSVKTIYLHTRLEVCIA